MDVRALGADVQYSSHVVNIVLRGLVKATSTTSTGSTSPRSRRSSISHLPTLTKHAVVPVEHHIANYAAFHRNVQNAVRGIGMSVFDDSLSYGSQSHRLRSVELFTSFFLTKHVTSTHEISHQWGSF